MFQKSFEYTIDAVDYKKWFELAKRSDAVHNRLGNAFTERNVRKLGDRFIVQETVSYQSEEAFDSLLSALKDDEEAQQVVDTFSELVQGHIHEK